MNIIWSDPAKKDYWNNIDYLLEEWTVNEVEHFTQETQRVINIISKKPKTFLKVGHKELRAVPITPQVSLYYRIDKENVTLIRFWNNYQDPINKPK